MLSAKDHDQQQMLVIAILFTGTVNNTVNELHVSTGVSPTRTVAM